MGLGIAEIYSSKHFRKRRLIPISTIFLVHFPTLPFFSFQNDLSVSQLNILYFYFWLLFPPFYLFSHRWYLSLSKKIMEKFIPFFYTRTIQVQKKLFNLQCFLTSKTRCKSQILEFSVPFNFNLSVLLPSSLYFTALL